MSDAIRQFFSQFTYDPLPAKGTQPVERRMFSIGVLDVLGKHLVFCDSWATPNDGVMVEVASGCYEVFVEGQSYGTDGRIARLVVKQPNTVPVRGSKRGSFGVDVASAAVCDGDVLESWASSSEEAWEEWLDTFINRDYDGEDLAGFFPCPGANTSMVYTSTGFGDGCYPVYELTMDGRIVGAEAVFLLPDQGYFESGPCDEDSDDGV